MTMAQTKTIMFGTATGENNLQVKIALGTVWMSQTDMALLFEKSKKTISSHVNNILKSGEVDKNKVIRNFKITAKDYKLYDVDHYSIDMVISVAYRVKSEQARFFRMWATEIVSKFIIDNLPENKN